MEETTLLLIAAFIVVLALSLLGLFIYLVVSTRADSSLAITRLHTTVTKIRNLDNANDRTFKEFEMLLNRKLRTVFSHRITKSVEFGAQTDALTELSLDVAVQTDMARAKSLPPLLVRPAISADVVIPISE